MLQRANRYIVTFFTTEISSWQYNKLIYLSSLVFKSRDPRTIWRDSLYLYKSSNFIKCFFYHLANVFNTFVRQTPGVHIYLLQIYLMNDYFYQVYSTAIMYEPDFFASIQ